MNPPSICPAGFVIRSEALLADAGARRPAEKSSRVIPDWRNALTAVTFAQGEPLYQMPLS
jgi:hypothetical protein